MVTPTPTTAHAEDENGGILDPMWSCILQDFEEDDEDEIDNGHWNLCAGYGVSKDRLRGWKENRAQAGKRRMERTRRAMEKFKQEVSTTSLGLLTARATHREISN